jgi:hypothetical protein
MQPRNTHGWWRVYSDANPHGFYAALSSYISFGRRSWIEVLYHRWNSKSVPSFDWKIPCRMICIQWKNEGKPHTTKWEITTRMTLTIMRSNGRAFGTLHEAVWLR